ncbi:uncharacterized protein N7518_003753 [Penicillium psychrosexuale]|uniref:uncharacterized protein n=1 Tax=Penicillium psychrosexuale TaxID=1002107 RepID=UPI002544E689|nr:uncharacterized protein N7518_003753 [Penicillium psychrosexuale]KAJ5801685.1 hypothetical protein N7518_003753 [Penicillium psychrosexuale]
MPSHSHLMDEITPSGSFLNPPLTPPPTEEKRLSRSTQAVLDCLELHRAGQRPPESWWQRRLTADDYSEVLRMLEGDQSLYGYVEDKVRLDYDPYQSLVTIRMPTPLHDIFCANFQNSDKPFAAFAKKIGHKSTSRIWLPSDIENAKRPYYKRNLDAQYPGIIMEVCYTNKARAAADLADDYILDTYGNVRVVITLTIEYRGSIKATISIWRPERSIVDSVKELQAIAKVEALPFRIESRLLAEDPAKGPAFRLSLRDFAPTRIS